MCFQTAETEFCFDPLIVKPRVVWQANCCSVQQRLKSMQRAFEWLILNVSGKFRRRIRVSHKWRLMAVARPSEMLCARRGEAGLGPPGVIRIDAGLDTPLADKDCSLDVTFLQ